MKWKYWTILLGCFSLTVLYAGNQQLNMKGTYDIRQRITEMKEALEKDTDQLPQFIRQIEEEIPSVSDPGTKAILHSMLAEMYQTFYRNDPWRINQRTPIAGYVPDDIREWTSNLFTQKVEEEIKASLQPAEVLQTIPALQFREIMETGNDSPELRPTLFDFLAWRALEIQPSEEIYEQLIRFRKSQPEENALVVAELAYIPYKYPAQEKQMEEIDRLLQIYTNKDIAVEIINAKLDLLVNQRYTFNNPDSIKALEWELIESTLKKYPTYPCIGLIQNKKLALETPSLQINLPGSVYPGKEIPVEISYQNTTSVEIELRKLDFTSPEIFNGSYNTKENKEKGRTSVYTHSLLLPVDKSYKQEQQKINLPAQENGFYELTIRYPEKELEVKKVLNVTTLAAVARTIPGRGTEVYVTDLMSGKPLENITIRYYQGTRTRMPQTGDVKTDVSGIALLPDKKEMIGFDAVAKDQSTTFVTPVYANFYRGDDEKVTTNVSLLTDRKLYRPGQTIQYKGIAYSGDKYNPEVVSNHSLKLSFYDANNQEVTSKMVKTNDYGSFHGEFTIPQQGLTGFWSLRTENGRIDIRVEEYKRPTFFIEFNPVKEDIARGDLVTLTGKVETFSGIPLAAWEGTYRIARYPMWPRISVGEGNEQVAEGTLQVLENGTFSIEYRTEKEEGTFRFPGWDRYEVSVKVTDNKGETHETTKLFTVGEKSIQLYVENLRPREDKENIRMKVRAQTMNGETVTTSGTFKVYPLIDMDQPYQWEEGKLLLTGQFETGQEIGPALFRTISSGRYRILFEVTDSRGRKVETSQDVVLYSKKDNSPPVHSPLWLVSEKDNYLPGETAEIVIGSSFKDAFILYEVLNGTQLISREIIKVSNRNRTLRIPFRSDWKDGILVSFTVIKEGQLYKETIGLSRRYPDRTLTFRPEVFRDRLKPGQEESWTFRVTGPDSLAVQAEVLALMYDMSLDQIYPSGINFSTATNFYISSYQFMEGEGLTRLTDYSEVYPEWLDIPPFSYDRLDWQGIPLFSPIMVRGVFSNDGITAIGRQRKISITGALTSMDIDALVNRPPGSVSNVLAGNIAGVREEMAMIEEDVVEPLPVTVADIRQNFNETAFFYPTLLTDSEGNVMVQFTIPESNTTWHLQMLAHTRDMKYGLYSNKIITQKPVMVVPNLPRFVRKGDRVTLSTQVINQTGTNLPGVVSLELFDPETGNPLNYQTGTARQEIRLIGEGTGVVSWELDIPYTGELLGVKIIATTPEGSDGEQHILPVVTDEVLITESTPFYMGEINHERVEIPANLFHTGNRPFSLTFEATANPIWYAVQALPGLAEPKNDNVIDWFNSYYANVVSRALVTTTPRLQTVIKAWEKQGGNAGTLLSQLQKNEELKQILLTETPWVMAAKNQTEQLQQLSLLFDINRAASQKETAFRKLQEQQMESGAWGWFRGFYPSRQMTLYVLKGMAQLTTLNAIEYNQQEKEMQIKALNYLDKEIREEYERLQKDKKQLKNYTPTPIQITYLLVRSSYRDIPEGESREAIRYYTEQAAGQWEKLSLSEKAQVALLMSRNGNKAVANKIADWFRKTATTSVDKGMYWANNRTSAGNFTSPIEVHVRIMEMLGEISPRQEETDRMKQWLLIQKRTQYWNTTPATLNAVYSLLKTGSGWLDSSNKLEIHWGDRTFSSQEGEAATGYLKETVNIETVTDLPSVVEIQKSGSNPAWGAVYAQYFAKQDQVVRSENVLNVEKKLFIETNNGEQRQITPVTADRPLRVGDKVVVRLTIRTDREMNYVHLHDLRPGYMEPAKQLSGTQYRDGIMYYSSPRDLSENFFIQRLPAGTFVVEYSGYVSRTGDYSGGLATIQCLYAPEYTSHTEGIRSEVK